LNNNRVI